VFLCWVTTFLEARGSILMFSKYRDHGIVTAQGRPGGQCSLLPVQFEDQRILFERGRMYKPNNQLTLSTAMNLVHRNSFLKLSNFP